MLLWRGTTTWRFFWYALCCFLLLALIAAAAYGFFWYSREKHDLEQALEQIRQVHTPNLIERLWITDYARVQQEIEAIIGFRHIQSAEVQNDEGRQFRAGPPTDPALQVLSTPLYYTHKDAAIPIGALTLSVNQRQITANLIGNVLLLLLVQAALSVLLALLLAGLFHTIVGKHLFEFTRFIQQDSPAARRQPFRLQGRGRHTEELQSLVTHFNALRDRISQYLDEMETANQELATLNAHLQASERQLRELLDIAPEPVFIQSRERFVYANSACLSLYGASDSRDLLGTSVRDRLPPPRSDGPHAPEAPLNEALQPANLIEATHLKIDGQPIEVEVSIAPIQYQGVPAALFFVRDISARKQMEARKHQLQKAASLERLAGAVAHHYNNLLMAVMGNLEIATVVHPESSDHDSALKDAIQAARRAADMGGLMLAYLGQTFVQRGTLDFTALCQEASAKIQKELPDTIRLETGFPATPLMIYADAEQIEGICRNLLTNAREALEDLEDAKTLNRGGRTIRMRLYSIEAFEMSSDRCFPVEFQPQKIPCACLEVQDCGPGMAEAEFDKIFDPFYSTKFTGRGLGLAVTLGAVRAHEGCITVESKPGQGSTFRVYLPLQSAL